MPLNREQYSNLWDEGYNAFFDKKPSTSCLYAEGSEERKAWMEGFNYAEETQK